jgi:hypothetical protein
MVVVRTLASKSELPMTARSIPRANGRGRRKMSEGLLGYAHGDRMSSTGRHPRSSGPAERLAQLQKFSLAQSFK